MTAGDWDRALTLIEDKRAAAGQQLVSEDAGSNRRIRRHFVSVARRRWRLSKSEEGTPEPTIFWATRPGSLVTRR
jgi:predicted secreted protein